MIETFFFLSLIFFVNNAYSSIWPTYISSSKKGCYQKAAVSTDAVPCASVGTYMLKKNGSAVDAAIAMLICVGANNPQSSGIGGGFLMTYYDRRKGRSYVIDAKEIAPMKARERYEVGPKSIAVPGELAGYEAAHTFFGILPWKDLFTPTIKMCKKGIKVSKHLERAIGYLMEGEKIRKMFFKKGRQYIAGERIKMPKLAKTLKVISKKGAKALYGPSKMSKKFLSDLKAAGSDIEKDDLLNYKTYIRNPVETRSVNGITLYSSPPPGSGLILAKMIDELDWIKDLDGYATKNDDKAAKIMHELIEINKNGNTYEKSFFSNWYKKKKVLRPFKCKASISLRNEQHSHTTHISVLAPNGDAVSVTSSINKYFGSHIVSSSTGIILNNQMADFPDKIITGGLRPRSSMAPSIFIDPWGQVKLVIGAAGGLAIGTVIMQVAARNLYLGENIKESIDAPRFHAYENFVRFEKHFPMKMRKSLEEFGHHSMDLMLRSVVIGIERTESGKICANSDFRKGGTVDGF